MSRSNNQWQQFYQDNQPTMVQSWSSHAATDATTMVTTTTNTNTNMNTSVSNQLNRVTRPTNTRRRSRASRRTPTTLLNTDTANFRAMVQRFTGGGNNAINVETTSSGGPYDSSVTSAHHHQFLNTSYNNSNISSSFNDEGVGLLRPLNEGYNVQFRAPNNDPYFTMMVADGGSTTAGNDGDDQHMGFRQKRVL